MAISLKPKISRTIKKLSAGRLNLPSPCLLSIRNCFVTIFTSVQSSFIRELEESMVRLNLFLPPADTSVSYTIGIQSMCTMK